MCEFLNQYTSHLYTNFLSNFLLYLLSSFLSVTITYKLLVLAPLHIHDNTQVGVLCILSFLVSLSALLKCVCTTIISQTSPNNLLPLNLIISLILTHMRYLKQILSFYSRINYTPVPEVPLSWVTYYLHPETPDSVQYIYIYIYINNLLSA